MEGRPGDLVGGEVKRIYDGGRLQQFERDELGKGVGTLCSIRVLVSLTALPPPAASVRVRDHV